MKFVACLLVVCSLAVGGCSTTAIKEVATSPNTFVACRAVDVASTIGILRLGGAELNPILAPLLHAGFGPFIIAELVITVGIMSIWDQLSSPQKVIVNGLSCAPAVWNSGVAAQMGAH
mgnify:FL=1